jgi:hypothetical protein
VSQFESQAQRDATTPTIHILPRHSPASKHPQLPTYQLRLSNTFSSTEVFRDNPLPLETPTVNPLESHYDRQSNDIIKKLKPDANTNMLLGSYFDLIIATPKGWCVQSTGTLCWHVPLLYVNLCFFLPSVGFLMFICSFRHSVLLPMPIATHALNAQRCPSLRVRLYKVCLLQVVFHVLDVDGA